MEESTAKEQLTFFDSKRLTSNSTFKFLRQEEQKYIFAKQIREEVLPGHLVNIHTQSEQKNGVVIDAVETSFTVRCPNLLEVPTKASWQKWWGLASGTTYLVSELAFVEGELAKFNLQCKVPKGTQRGQVRWSLYYEGIEIVKGVDWQKPGYCAFARQGYRWKEGEYIFRARLLKGNFVSTAETVQQVTFLSSPSDNLSFSEVRLCLT